MDADEHKILAIDASTDTTQLVLHDGQQTVVEDCLERYARGETPLFKHIADLLVRADWAMDAITRFAVGLGPGSFSGIRSVLSALQAMALPMRTPVIGISTGAAIACQLRKERGANRVTVIGDARRNRLWLGAFSADTMPSHTEADYRLISRDAVAAETNRADLVASPDWERISHVLTAQVESQRLIQRTTPPSAAAIAELSIHTISCQSPTPIYMHPPVARVL